MQLSKQNSIKFYDPSCGDGYGTVTERNLTPSPARTLLVGVT